MPVLLAGLLINLVSSWLTTLLQRHIIHGDAERRFVVTIHGLAQRTTWQM